MLAPGGGRVAAGGERAQGEGGRGARRRGVERPISLRASYAMSGTDIAYGTTSHARAMQCPVLT
eukprot:1602117-Rhodomonas_salina.2